MMLVASDPESFVPAQKRRLPPPLLASPCPVARDPASPLARACRSCGKPARPACSWRGVRSRQAGAGMMGSMTRWSCPSPSPAARRFRERSCRPSLPLPCDLHDAFPSGVTPWVPQPCDRQAGRSACRNVHPPVCDWWNENLGFTGASEARSYRPWLLPPFPMDRGCAPSVSRARSFRCNYTQVADAPVDKCAGAVDNCLPSLLCADSQRSRWARRRNRRAFSLMKPAASFWS